LPFGEGIGVYMGSSTFDDLVGKTIGNAKVQNRLKVVKSDDEKRLVFGWASVAVRVTGEEIEDFQSDILEIQELEQAAYHFVSDYGTGGEMHERGGVSTLIESVVFTKEKAAALGIPEGNMPEGWWVGFRVDDDDVWEKVKDGTYSMFSIEGTATREEIKEEG